MKFLILLGILFVLFLLALVALMFYMVYSDLFGKTKSPYRMLAPVDFPGRNAMIAEDQEEYITLPAYISEKPEGWVVCCWRLTYLDRIKLLFTGVLWSSTMTFRQPLQPVTFSIHKSDVLN